MWVFLGKINSAFMTSVYTFSENAISRVSPSLLCQGEVNVDFDDGLAVGGDEPPFVHRVFGGA